MHVTVHLKPPVGTVGQTMVPVGVAADRVYSASHVTMGRGELLPRLSTLTALCEHKTAVYLCCTIPEVTLGGRYPLSLPCAARTFLIPEGTRPSAPVTVSIITQKTDGRKFFSCYFGLRRIKSRLSTQASVSTAGKVSHTPVTPSSALSANSTGGMAMMLRTSEMIKPREACPAALK